MWHGIASWLEEDEDGNNNDGYVLVTGKLYLCSTMAEKLQMYSGLKEDLMRI